MLSKAAALIIVSTLLVMLAPYLTTIFIRKPISYILFLIYKTSLIYRNISAYNYYNTSFISSIKYNNAFYL